MTYLNQTFYENEPHPLLWAGPWAARGKIVISGIPSRLNSCVICIVHTCTIYKCGCGPHSTT